MDVNIFYDVFLNHRGPDTKKSFMSHLVLALKNEGLNPFLDYKAMQGREGETAQEIISDALQVVSVHVAVVSKETEYPLDELVTMMGSGKPVIPILYDVDYYDLKVRNHGRGLFAAAFQKHEAKRRYSPERLSGWKDALLRLASKKGFRLADYEDEAELICKVVDLIMTRHFPHLKKEIVTHKAQKHIAYNELCAA